MSLSQFLGILIARRWMIIIAVFASVLGAAAVVAVLPPRYTASTRLLLDIIKPDPVTGQVLGNQFVRAYTQTQTELIRDYKVAGPVVDELGWTNNPAMLEKYQVAGDPNGARRRMAQVIIDNTTAKVIEGSNILEITYTAWSADAAKTVADAIRRSYVDSSLSFKRDSAGESADWYQGQADKAQRLLNIAEVSKAKFEREHGLVMQPDKSDIDSLRLSALSGVAPSAATPATTALGSTSSSAAMELANVDAQLAQARRTLGPNHPTIVQLQQRHNALSAEAAQERAMAGAATAAARNAANAAGSAAGEAARELAAQKAKVLANRDNLIKLRALQDEVDLRRDQYTKAAQRSAELRLQSAADDSGLTLLSNAVAPERPSFPNIPLISIGSIVFGLILGILAALLTELLNRRIRSPRDMQEAAEDAPLLAVVGSARREKQRPWTNLLRLPDWARPQVAAE